MDGEICQSPGPPGQARRSCKAVAKTPERGRRGGAAQAGVPLGLIIQYFKEHQVSFLELLAFSS